MANLYISDLHFDHANVIRFDNRPFNSVEEMNSGLVTLWNETVKSDDTVYILGDFCWGKADRWKYFLNQMSGNKVLIAGNHDLKQYPNEIKNKFCDIKDYKRIDDNGRQVILSHYPIACYQNSFYGAIHLYGHVHMTGEHYLMEKFKELRKSEDLGDYAAYNVGCMLPYMHYIPRTLDEIITGYNQQNQSKGIQ
jgi:calcineurin-like phosphoesterase family protein